jgi:uncharacterized protein YkwD
VTRALAALALVGALVAGDVAVAHYQRPTERAMTRRIRHARAVRDLPRLSHGTRLHRFGRRQVERMIDCGCVMHAQPPRFCGSWGQTVGIGTSVRRIFRAFMGSPEHRRILLGEDWRRSAVGARRVGDLAFVAVEFCGVSVSA